MRQEQFLGARLAKDRKYSALYKGFQEMRKEQLVIRYGDYHKGNVFTIKSKCQEMAKKKYIKEDVLAKMDWRQILEAVDAEKGQKEEASPITTLMRRLCELCKIELEQALFDIKAYVNRNDVAHNGMDNLIALKLWAPLAALIVTDTEDIKRGTIGNDESFNEKMLQSLDIFQRRYFAWIKTEVNNTGEKTLSLFQLSDEEAARQAAAQAAKLANEAQLLKKKQSEEIFERAQSAKHNGWSLQTTQTQLMEAKDDMDKKKAACKEVQGTASTL
jgi:hypothetical protein